MFIESTLCASTVVGTAGKDVSKKKTWLLPPEALRPRGKRDIYKWGMTKFNFEVLLGKAALELCLLQRAHEQRTVESGF